MKSRSSISIAAGITMALALSAPASAVLTVQNFWHMGESGGNLPTDSVGGKNFTGQVGNQTVSTAVHAPGSTASLHYDGYGGTYMADPSNGPTVPSDNFVIELWVNPHSYGSDVNLVSLGTDTGSGRGWAKIGLSSAGTVFFGREGESYGDATSTPLALDTWTHLAFVQTGGKIHGYINGLDAPTYDNNSNSHNNNGAVHLGVQPGNAQWLDGYLDEVRFSTFAPGAFTPKDLLVNAVPEPTSMAALGLGALAMLKRRRSRKA